MLGAIEKLQKEKEKLTTEFEENRKKFKSETKRIDIAIRKFSQGFEALGNSIEIPRKRGIAAEVEKILTDSGPKHVNDIVEELCRRGFDAKYQSVSAVLQIYAKSKKKFLRILPATYALMRSENRMAEISSELNEQIIEFDEKLPDEILNDDEDMPF